MWISGTDQRGRRSRPIAAACSYAFLYAVLTAAPPLAVAGDEPYVPDALSPWVDWVLQDSDERACPLGGVGEGERVCAWPGPLVLDVDDKGGRFEQRWTLQAESWLPLPGGGAQWPQQVSTAGEPVAVVEHQGRPSVRLAPGTYRLTGQFVWPRRPEVLAVPAETGLLSVRLNGTDVRNPRLDDSGRLWLGRAATSAQRAEPDMLSLEVARLIDDDVPLQVRTRITLDVSGQTREVRLGPVMLEGGIPLSLDSPLPARLVGAETEASDATPLGSTGQHNAQEVVEGADENAMLQVQLRPGRWELTLVSHHAGPVEGLTLPERRHGAPPGSWSEQEVWAFSAHPDLRQVEIVGAEPIDPRQTRLPAAWRQLPAYLMRPGMTLQMEQLRRGASGADQVQLSRELRLDFDGAAFSVRDHLSGQLAQRWRLDADPILRLGQVRVDGEPRLITRLSGDDALEGVEVRRGRLDLIADARIESGPVGWRVALPSSGWAFPLDTAAARLSLPPGWDLLAVEGVDNLPDSWLARWSLLDIFLVLVASLAIGRLWGWHWGLLGLLTLVLTWQEPGSPRWVWLHVLAATALLRVLPERPVGDAPEGLTGRGFRTLATLVRLYYRGALLVLALIAVPFLVTEMRDGLFPQLEREGAGIAGILGAGDASVKRAATSPSFDQRAPMVLSDSASAEATVGARLRKRETSLGRASPAPLPKLDPDARLQTGAGVPDWTWRSFTLTWSGALPPDHRLRLWLLPPAVALMMAVAQLLLVPLLGLRLAGLLSGSSGTAKGAVLSVTALMLGGVVLAQPGTALAQPGPGVARPAAAADAAESWETSRTATPSAATSATSTALGAFPPEDLLDALEQRLLKPPDCLPRCAEVARMVLDASASELRLLLAVDAAVAVALQVPGSRDSWSPALIELDGQPLDRLRAGADGILSVPVPAGRHLLLLSGPLPDVDQLDIPLPMRPRLVEASVDTAWQLEGVAADGRPGDQLRLLRQRSAASAQAGPASSQSMGQGALPPLLRVTRTLRFGLDWSMTTEVRRLSPPAAPVTLRLPLVPQEAVVSADMQVADGRILVSLPPGRERTGWSSTLKPVERLTLTAARDPRLSEEWRMEISPLWHLSAEGVPPVQNLGTADQWLPAWRPWPGETLELTLSRPVAVPGPTLTLDQSRYRVTPGRRASEALLELTLRSSQGGRHRIELPSDAELTRLSVDGQQRPLALQGNALDLPLIPGSQEIVIGWREPTPLDGLYRPAAVALGTPGVNAETQVALGRARWVLWTAGPGIGPAVQFWGLLVVLAALAVLLARSRLTPLGFVDWLLLGVGLSQVGVWVGALVVLWLFALGLRRRLDEQTSAWRFNLAQVGLVLLSIAALLSLLAALQQGLLGSPEMQIAGNGSTATELTWYLDRQGPQTTAVTIVSAPIWVYRALMLAWALWLAWRLLGWLRWGWRSLSEPVLWRESRRQQLKARAGGEDLSLDI